MSVDEKRNQQGLQRLRSRYIRRAQFLVADRPFQDRIERAKDSWNRFAPEYPVGRHSPEPKPEDIMNNDVIFYPLGLLESCNDDGDSESDAESPRRLVREWEGVVGRGDLVEIVFPPRYFFNPHLSRWHPAALFISACMMFDPRSLDRIVEHLFPLDPQFTLRPVAFYLDRSDQYSAAFEKGRAEYLAGELRRILAHDKGELDRILSKQWTAGIEQAKLDAPLGGGWSVTPAFWYLPIYPLMSESDIGAAAAAAVQVSLEEYGSAPIDQMVTELYGPDGRISQQRVADLLGISIDTVRNVLRKH